MGWTMGWSACGRRSRLTARVLRRISVHCQSQCAAVGNSARAGWFTSHQSPSIRLQVGPISAFQNTGTRASGGLHQSKSALRGRNKTLPPADNFFSALSQELVTKASREVESGTCAGYSQKFQSFMNRRGELCEPPSFSGRRGTPPRSEEHTSEL